MIEDLVEYGYYPVDLVLLQETSITLTELDKMDNERKWLYYYYIMAAKEKQRKDANKPRGEKPKKSVHIDFPADFVSQLEIRKEKGKK